MKKNIILNVLAALCLSLVLVSALPMNSIQHHEGYDPWLDTDDNGIIDMRDIYNEAMIFGSIGTPINKTSVYEQLSYSRTIRFYSPNETANNDPNFIDAAVFVWTPNNKTNNAILSLCCYFQYNVSIYFQVVVNNETVLNNADLHEGYNWSMIYPLPTNPYRTHPNQEMYTIVFQICRTGYGFPSQVKDINIVIEAVDGMPSS
jgi:hypothetical protein